MLDQQVFALYLEVPYSLNQFLHPPLVPSHSIIHQVIIKEVKYQYLIIPTYL